MFRWKLVCREEDVVDVAHVAEVPQLSVQEADVIVPALEGHVVAVVALVALVVAAAAAAAAVKFSQNHK
jgi:hypothetical protein